MRSARLIVGQLWVDTQKLTTYVQPSSRPAGIVACGEAERLACYAEHVRVPLRVKLEAHGSLA